MDTVLKTPEVTSRQKESSPAEETSSVRLPRWGSCCFCPTLLKAGPVVRTQNVFSSLREKHLTLVFGDLRTIKQFLRVPAYPTPLPQALSAEEPWSCAGRAAGGGGRGGSGEHREAGPCLPRRAAPLCRLDHLALCD